MMHFDHKNILRLVLLQILAITSIGCITGPENKLDLPPDIARNIPYLPGLIVDGGSGDWNPDYVPLRIFSDVCGNIPDTTDFQASFRMAWNEKGIFLLAEIKDDSLYEDPDHFWKGDGLELFLSQGRGSPNILQVSVRPGFDKSDSMATINAYNHLRSVSINTSEASIVFYSAKTSLGYLLEGMIPFEMINTDPQQDLVMATQLYLNDADREDDPNNYSLPWYSVRESYMNPYAFHNVSLTFDRYPEMLPELRICIVDEKTVQIKVISDRIFEGEVFRIISGSFKQRFKHKPIMEWTLPVEKISSGGEFFVGLLNEDQVLDVLDLGMAQHVYEKTDPPEWYENEIRIFEIMDRYDPPPDSVVLFTGSSTIRRWYNLAEDMYPQIVINRGFGGSVMKELNQNINRIVFPYKPFRIFVYEGDNDITKGTKPSSFLEECKVFISQCQQRLPGTEIIFLSIKPSPSRMRHWKRMDRANHLLKDLCMTHENVNFIDISTPMFKKPGILKDDIYAEDGVHLNDKGYALLRHAIMESANKLSN
jgi:lysophospholipase L1-like esterase